MKEKKTYTPPRSYSEQKEMHTKILLGTIILTVIVVIMGIVLTIK